MQWLPPAVAVRERYGLGNSRDRSLTRPPGPTARLVQSVPRLAKADKTVALEENSGVASLDYGLTRRSYTGATLARGGNAFRVDRAFCEHTGSVPPWPTAGIAATRARSST